MANDVLNILRGASGGGSQGTASSMLPGFNAGTSKQVADIRKQIAALNKLVKSGKADWKEYAKVGPLAQAYRETNKLRKAQEELLRVRNKNRASIGEQTRAYENVIKAQRNSTKAIKEANFAMNETKGAAGRLKNVLDKAFEAKGAMLLTAALKDLNIVGTSMVQNFDQLASRGQLASMSVGELAKVTGLYTARIKAAAVQSAMFGINVEESQRAFAKLTSIYGANEAAAKQVSDSWEDLNMLSVSTGVGLESVADLAAQGYARLGESLEDVKGTIGAVGMATKEMNDRFGAAAPTATMLTNAIKDMAFSKGLFNQSSRVLADTLTREISLQLALGKTQEAAVGRARQNVEMAGEVNLVGIKDYRDKIAAQFAETEGEEREAFLANIRESMGPEGEIIANMLEQGTFTDEQNLFALEEMLKNSSVVQQHILESIREAAASGNIEAARQAGFRVGVDNIGKIDRLFQEQALLSANIEKMRAGGTVKGMALEKSEEGRAFLQRLRNPEPGQRMSNREAQLEFMKLSGVGDTEEISKAVKEGEEKVPEYKKFIDEVGMEKGWARGVANSLNVIPGLLNELPMKLGTVLGGLLATKVLGRALGNIAMPKIGRIPKPPKGVTPPKGMLKTGGKLLGGVARKAALPLTAAMTIYDAISSPEKARELFGEDASAMDMLGVFGAKSFDALTLGLTGMDDEKMKAMARGSHQGVATMLGDALFAAYDKYKHGNIVLEDAKRKETATRSVTSPKTRPADQAPPAESVKSEVSSSSASAQGHISGNNLILEVTNWESVFAQTQNNLTSSES